MTVPQAAVGSLIRRAQTAPSIELDQLSPPGGLLVIVPHPDDETLGCGMALAAAADAGRTLGIVLMTDGEGSHPGSAAYPPERLRAVRRAEFDTALEALVGAERATVRRLGLPDGRCNPALVTEEQFGTLRELAQTINARAVWTTWSHDQHCDHETAAVAGHWIAQFCDIPLWTFAVWGRFGNVQCSTEKISIFFSARHADRKRTAMAAYRSQLTGMIDDDPSGFLMPPQIVEHLAGHSEIFIYER